MRWPCRGDTGKLISPCSDGATCSRAFYDLIMKNVTTTSSRNAAISPYSSDIARILLGNIHGRADAPHPALAGCAHAVSGHVAAVHIGSFLRRGNPDPRMSLVGR